MKQILISIIAVIFITIIIPLAIVQIFNAKNNAISTMPTQSPIMTEGVAGV